jgi:glycerophosphoryl diester phosphodiesterase
MKLSIVSGVIGLLVMGLSGCSTRTVDMIAHRGASYLAPENTRAAVLLGWEKEADVEVDVHLSLDKRIMVIHDATAEHLAGVDLKVSETHSEALRKLDMGSFKRPEFAGEQMPFLEEIIQTIPAKRKLYVEIKCGQEILPYLVELVRQSGKMSQIVIIGFDLKTVTRSKQVLDVPTYWLKGTAKDKETDTWIPHDPNLVQTARENGLDGLDVHHAGITEELVNAARDAGQKLYTWTVDDPEEARRLVRLKVDGITTNRPAWLRSQLQN